MHPEPPAGNKPLRTWITQIGAEPEDSPELRLTKTIMLVGSLAIGTASIIWGLAFIYYDEGLTGSLSLLYAGITLLLILRYVRTRRYHFFRFSQLFLGLLLPFLEHLTLGGFRNSGGVLMWSLMSPLGALLLLENSAEVVRWWLAYAFLVIAGGALQPYLQPANHLPPAFIEVLFVINITAISSIAIFFLLYFVNQKNEFLRRLRIEEAKSEALLLNILPKEIAAILKNENRVIAERFDESSILFADMVGFTPLAAKMAPEQMVNLLNEIFSNFDALVEKYKLEKIRTIGDSYMVASGAPRRRPDHAQVLARLALEMRDYLNSRIQGEGALPLSFRMGLNSGPVIGGVIGKKKFVYDVWGDTVNVASRMESHGLAGEIHISQPTYELIKDEFVCEPRGEIAIKGRGEMQTWFLRGKM